MTTNWIEENARDAHLLGHMELSPLDAGIVLEDEQLATKIAASNAEQIQIKQRFENLILARKAMNDETRQFECDSATVRRSYRQLIDESWDVLLALKQHAQQQQDILQQMAEHLMERQNALVKACDKAHAKSQRKQLQEHSAYIKSNPGIGQVYVESLAEEDETVVSLNEQIHQLHAWQASLESRRYRIHSQSREIVLRQREVIVDLMC